MFESHKIMIVYTVKRLDRRDNNNNIRTRVNKYYVIIFVLVGKLDINTR